jgi:cobaltochelatase CobN
MREDESKIGHPALEHDTMHLKLDPSGPIDTGDVARDLGQETADIVVLSAADNELAVFASARAGLPAAFPSVQFTNFLALGHPMSVDA